MTRNGSFVMLLPLRCSLRGLMTRASRPTSSIAISLFHWHTQQLLAQRDGKRHQRERERGLQGERERRPVKYGREGINERVISLEQKNTKWLGNERGALVSRLICPAGLFERERRKKKVKGQTRIERKIETSKETKATEESSHAIIRPD